MRGSAQTARGDACYQLYHDDCCWFCVAQVADILLMLRQDDEPPSDFQDYTLVAISAVAAHLMKAGLGDDYGLPQLAERHGHDTAVLDQVFWHILHRLSFYRELHVKSQQMVDVSEGITVLRYLP